MQPRGEARDDWHAAQLSWAIFESQRTEGTRKRLSDHLLTFTDPRVLQQDDEADQLTDEFDEEQAMRSFFDAMRGE